MFYLTISWTNYLFHAFDRTKRIIVEDIVLDVEIRPFKFQVTFQVMDIYPTYAILLERPWIHFAGVVPSILH